MTLGTQMTKIKFSFRYLTLFNKIGSNKFEQKNVINTVYLIHESKSNTAIFVFEKYCYRISRKISAHLIHLHRLNLISPFIFQSLQGDLTLRLNVTIFESFRFFEICLNFTIVFRV